MRYPVCEGRCSLAGGCVEDVMMLTKTSRLLVIRGGSVCGYGLMAIYNEYDTLSLMNAFVCIVGAVCMMSDVFVLYLLHIIFRLGTCMFG